MTQHRLAEVADILQRYDHQILGNQEAASFDSVGPIDGAEPGSLSWVASEKHAVASAINATKASVVIAENDVPIGFEPPVDKCVVLTANPKVVFARIVNRLFVERPEPGVHPTAVIHAEADVSASAYIGPHCVLGRCKIGADTILWGDVYVYDHVEVGDRCVVHAGCVLGASGQGYARDADGAWVPFPQLGRTVIEDDVEIGALSYVTRGALGDTVIRRGAKIGLSTCVGHGVEIGADAMVIANTVVCGSARVGAGAWLAPSTTVRNGVVVGEDAVVGMGAVVTKDVSPAATVVGNPAEELDAFREWTKVRAALMRDARDRSVGQA
jgi:UDP-3-O-[3-hydroxymyristoyl] glucosamine N-acyltransferase